MRLPKPARRVEALGAERATPALLACIHKLARRTGETLLRESRPFSAAIADTRLALEVAVIQAYAERLTAMLRLRDPLSERVHLGKAGTAGLGLVGLIRGGTSRIGRMFSAQQAVRRVGPLACGCCCATVAAEEW